MSYGKTNPDASRKAEDKARKGPAPKLCKDRVFGKPCKECTQVAKLYQSEEETDNNLASRCRARPNFYFVVVDLKDKGSGRQLYPCGIDNFKVLNDFLPNPKDPDDENVDYTSVKKPYPVLIKRKGSGLKTKYTITVSKNTTKIPPKLLKLKPLDLSRDGLLKILENEEVPIWTPTVDATNKLFIFPPAKGKEKNFGELWYHWNSQLLGIGVEDEDDEFEEDDDSYEDDDDGDDDSDFEDDDDDDDDDDDGEDEDDDDEDEMTVPKFAKMNDKKLRRLAKDEELDISKKKLKNTKGKKLRKLVEKKWREEYDIPI